MATWPERGQKAPNFWDEQLKDYIDEPVEALHTAVDASETRIEALEAGGGDASDESVANLIDDGTSSTRAALDTVTAPLEARLPKTRTTTEDVAHAHVDSAGRRSWLEASSADGGPTDWAETRMRDRLALGKLLAPGILFSVTDAAGLPSDLTVRSTDGQVEDWVIQRWASRIAPLLDGSTPTYADAPYQRGSTVLPVFTKTDSWAGWGSSTIEGLASRFSAMVAPAIYYAGGKGSERIEHHAARMNARPALLTFPGNSIPASGPVVVTSTNMPANVALKPYAGAVAGVHGTLSSTATEVTFTRTTPGDATPAAPDTPFESDPGLDHRADTLLLQVGKNSLTDSTLNSAAYVAGIARQMYEYAAPLHKRVLMIGQFVNGGTPSVAPTRDRINGFDNLMRDFCGPTFFDTTAWVTSADVWEMPGAPSPTVDDLAEQAIGNKPPSLSADPGHFNAIGYDLYRTAIQEHLTGLGWL